MYRQLGSFLPRLLSLLFLFDIVCSDAAAGSAPLNPRQGYAQHDPHLNNSRHHEDFFTFVSRPDITMMPRWDIQVYDESRISPGYWLISPYASFTGDVPGPNWTAPYIYNGNGDLIWYGGYVTNSWTVSDFRVSNVLGQPMLTFIHHREQKAYLIDETYGIHRKVDLNHTETSTVNGHEFALVDDGTRAIHYFNQDGNATREESAKIGYEGNCAVRYHGIRELDTRSWEPVFSWIETDHIALEESYEVEESSRCAHPGRPFDSSHLNALHKFPDGDYLVSSRRTFTLYKVSHKDGSIIWRLGGKRSDFKADTAWTGQHGARLHSQNDTHIILSFLDNAKYSPSIPPTHENSRALFLVLHVTERPMRAETLLSIDQPLGEYNLARGNVQVLPNGNIRACWVTNCLFSEHDKDGTILMKARLKPAFTTYRGYKFDWIGRPSVPPDVHAAAVMNTGKLGVLAHVSWNGATEVDRWKLWRSDADGQLSDVIARTDWQGFESSMQSWEFAEYVVVEALDVNGRTLGHSDVFQTIVPRELVDSAVTAEQQWQWQQDYPADTPLMSTTTYKLYKTVQNPIVQIVCGTIVALVIVAVATWVVLRQLRGQTQVVWWNTKEKAYEPVSTIES